jgi:beta-galactosidase
MKFRLSETTPTENDLNTDYNDPLWVKAFKNGYGEYEAGKNIIIKGIFDLADFNDNTEITFYVKSLAGNQSVYVNGKLIGKDLKRDDPNQVFVLDHSILKKGRNMVVFSGKPFVKQTQWEEINTNPGTIKVYNPAPQWKRKTFNGLAQVIVKTTKQAGEITLTASSEGLAPATLKIMSERGILRPSTEEMNK